MIEVSNAFCGPVFQVHQPFFLLVCCNIVIQVHRRWNKAEKIGADQLTN